MLQPLLRVLVEVLVVSVATSAENASTSTHSTALWVNASECGTTNSFKLKIVGSCSMLPCSPNHGDNVECKQLADLNIDFHGSLMAWLARIVSFPTLLFGESMDVCHCAQNTCSLDGFSCKRYEDWLKAQSDLTINPGKLHWPVNMVERPNLSATINSFLFALWTLFMLVLGAFMMKGVSWICQKCINDRYISGRLEDRLHRYRALDLEDESGSDDDKKCQLIREGCYLMFSLKMLFRNLVPDPLATESKLWTLRMCNLFEIVLFSGWFVAIWLFSGQTICAGSQSVFVGMDHLMSGFILVVLGQVRFEVPKCFCNEWDFMLHGTLAQLEAGVDKLGDPGRRREEYLKLIQMLCRIIGINLLLTYGMMRHFTLTVFTLLLWIGSQTMYTIHGTSGSEGFAHDWNDAKEESYTWEPRDEKQSPNDPVVKGFFKKDEVDDVTAVATGTAGTSAETDKWLGLTPSDAYMDMSLPLGKRPILTFLVQVLLSCLYVSSLRDDIFDNLCDGSVGNHWLLMLATCGVQVLMATQMGNSFIDKLIEWTKLLHARKLEGGSWNADVFAYVGDKRSQIDMPAVRVRFLMSCLINSIIYKLLIHTVFLALIFDDDGMDYVKDTLAIAFITQLDDLDYDSDRIFIKLDVITKSIDHMLKRRHGPNYEAELTQQLLP